MYLYGLIGYPLSHSFSKKYFSEKFANGQLDGHRYELFPLQSIDELPKLIAENSRLIGLNVTIPHKQAVFKYLDEIDSEAASIGAVNVIKIKNGKLKGYNSDVYGFEKSLLSLLGKNTELNALILGTGGASKAVRYILDKLKIPSQFVSRTKKNGQLIYAELNPEIIKNHRLIINTTPLGTYPDILSCPNIPYQFISKNHFLFDLVYNPPETLFLKKGKEKGAATCNGLPMLHLQAERAWEIWNE
ncbi:MAG TPA: shikimate dehydrogenase [Bacteroidetes bacterium]|nr:shikimate dehydrogenase [Bacteroidota bacterium]